MTDAVDRRFNQARDWHFGLNWDPITRERNNGCAAVSVDASCMLAWVHIDGHMEQLPPWERRRGGGGATSQTSRRSMHPVQQQGPGSCSPAERPL